jgi:hypothetical protein
MPSHLCTLLGCIVTEGVEPSALPSVRQQVTGSDPPVYGLVHASAATTCFTSVLKVDLPIGSLNSDVELAQLARHLVGSGPQIANGQGREHLQLRAQLPRVGVLIGGTVSAVVREGRNGGAGRTAQRRRRGCASAPPP